MNGQIQSHAFHYADANGQEIHRTVHVLASGRAAVLIDYHGGQGARAWVEDDDDAGKVLQWFVDRYQSPFPLRDGDLNWAEHETLGLWSVTDALLEYDVDADVPDDAFIDD